MNFDQYRPLALRTAKMFPTAAEDMRHAALGLITEIGEFTSEVKRVVVYGKPLTDEMKAHMREELGDAMWYIPLALTVFGVTELPDVSADYERIEDVAQVSLLLSIQAAAMSALALAPEVAASHRYKILECLAATLGVIEKGATLIGTTGDQLRAENIAKLQQRYPDKYSDEAAEARADKGGLSHKES